MAKPIALILSLVLSLLLLTTACVNGYDRFVGGRTVVKDVKRNNEVQELGKFCVEEFNRSQRPNDIYGKLRFSEVVEAQKQVVAGIKYYLTIVAATENEESQIFDSVVVVKPWVHSKELLNFGPSN